LAERIAAAYPQGEHMTVPDSGHYIHKDQPDAVVAATVAVTAQIVHDRAFD
jgi:pimeloyl-ACP methyl ester carboxylesterase